MVTDIISEKHISEEIQEDKCWDWELILAIQHLFLNSKRKAVTFLFPVTNRFQREITERLLLPAPSNRHCFSILHSPFQQRWPKAKRLHRETKRVFFLLGKEREKERERYLRMRVYPTETAHSCWLTDPHWGQDILGRAHTPWVIHQFISYSLYLSIPSLPVKTLESRKPFHWTLPILKFPLTLHSLHRVGTLRFNLFQVTHIILLTLFKITCALFPNKVMLPTGVFWQLVKHLLWFSQF